MKILVCVSNVPDTTTKITFTNNNTELNTNGISYILNPYDEIALSRAVELTENGNGTVTTLNVGELNTEPTIRKTLAIGATDAIRVNAKPRDAYFVAKQIAAIAQANNYDMILTGRESIDYNGSQVASMVGEFLDIPSINSVKKLDVNGNGATLEREIEGGKEMITVAFPFVASATEGMAEWKIPNMRGIMAARTKPLVVVEAVEVPTNTNFIDYEQPKPRGQVNLVSTDQPENLIDLLHNEAKVF